jgi:hypothetical protein
MSRVVFIAERVLAGLVLVVLTVMILGVSASGVCGVLG